MNLLITVNKKQLCNVAFINVISKVFNGIVVVTSYDNPKIILKARVTLSLFTLPGPMLKNFFSVIGEFS